MKHIPSSDVDLYSDHTLTHTREVYRELRQLGPVVHLPASDGYAVTQFDALRIALRADSILVNGEGVAANDIINAAPKDTTLTSDGDTHLHRRGILQRPLLREPLQTIKADIEASAHELVASLLRRDRFCGVADFATHLPLTIVAELVGLSDQGKDRMLEWAAATFNALGPLNERCEQALPVALSAVEYVHQLTPETVVEDGWAYRVLRAKEEGELSGSEASMMIMDYVAPSLDTTILATAHLLWLLGTHPNALVRLRDNPKLVGSTVTEAVRLASPIRCFTRYANADFELEGFVIPASSRVAVLYASGNWDEQHYEQPDSFQIDRNPRDQMGWGFGMHTCAGMQLARLEMESLLKALIHQVERIQVGSPTPLMNNILQGFTELPASLH
ncbi:MAG: cytochrome P450 [Pseudomonadota bacterium]